MQMKKPAWASMQVLDVRSLSEDQLSALGKAFDALSSKELSAISELDADPVRQEIDAAICKAFNLPDLAPIRELLAREPGLSAEDIATSGLGEDSEAALTS
jgi:hypothetical protein